jgi:hypothetical protein
MDETGEALKSAAPKEGHKWACSQLSRKALTRTMERGRQWKLAPNGEKRRGNFQRL